MGLKYKFLFFLNALFFLCPIFPISKVDLGVDAFFKKEKYKTLEGKKIGLVLNHTSVNQKAHSTLDLFLQNQKDYQVICLFSPEHGWQGKAYASDFISDEKGPENLTIYSLHGATKRPTEKMLSEIDTIIYDIQGVGSRTYTYETTLFYVMEEAAKYHKKVIVFDRPNPMGGIIVDGCSVDEKLRSFIGYLQIPYCHGMTIGELALFFNEEYNIGCDLEVIAMDGWKREMLYKDTGLHWIPPSPHIPESDTPLYYPATGILGELHLLNIGVGYTLPFKVIGAPWIDANLFAEKLNAQNLPGVKFVPFYYRPFYGMYKNKDINGIIIQITDPKEYRPLSVQYLILGLLKSLYPTKFQEAIQKENRLFKCALGSEKLYEILKNEKYSVWKLIELAQSERKLFLEKRSKYLLKEYE